MKRFGVGERVLFEHDGRLHRGRVTGLLQRARRVVTDERLRRQVPLSRLRRSPDDVLVLETCLDRSIGSRRTYADMLVQWLHAYGVRALRERVHTKQDLAQFLRREGRRARTRVIHIISHGSAPGPGEHASLKLTFEHVDLHEDAAIFEGLGGKVLIFSCCGLGAATKTMTRLKRVSGASAVVAYRVVMEDSSTNLHEVLLYERLITSSKSPVRLAREVASTLYSMGVKPRGIVVRAPALVAF